MPVYIPPNRNLVPATPDITGSYTKTESDSRFVHNFGNELINGIKIFSNAPTLSNSAKITNITTQKVLTTDVSGVIISTPFGINDLALKTTTDALSSYVSTEISNRINGDNYLQQQINQVSSAQYLVFCENLTGNGITTQFRITGNVSNAQFVSGGWNVINVQNALPSDVTDVNGKPIYDASIVYLFTRHRIGVNSITGNGYVNLDYIPQNNQLFKVWYWYSLTDFDRIDNYYRDDYVAKMEETAGELATATAVNTVNFGNILSSNDNTVQKALDTIDDVAITKTEVATVSGYLLNQISGISIASSGGSILVNKNGTAFNLEVASAPVSNHNSLLGLQGGTSGEYYHLTASEYGSISGAALVNTSVQLPWKYDNNINSGDPGNGKFRLNTISVSSTNKIYISRKTDNGIDAYNIINNMTVGDKIYLQNSSDATQAILASISGSITNNSTWFSIPVSVDSQASSNTFANNKTFSFVLINTVAVDTSQYTLLTTTANISSQLISITFAASANALAQTTTIAAAMSANAYQQADNYADAKSYATSANALAQAKTITYSASANALVQANVFTTNASGNISNIIAGVSQSLSGYVPYSGAIFDVNLGSHKLTTDAIIVNNSSIAPIPRQISWNDLDKTFNMGLTSEVTLQVGQEELTRVYNGNAYNIFSGQPVYITNIINDNPSVALAQANNNEKTRVAGVATETISSGGTGFITNKGKVRGLNTSGYNTGDQIYLGEISGTFTNQTSGFAYQSHVNPIGYIGIVDSISGSIFVTITTESTLLSLSERETNVVLGNSISTGVYEFTGMTGIGSSSFVIPPLKGWIVENTETYSTAPIVTNVVYNGGTFPVTNISTQDFTFILISKTNTITQQSTFPTPQQRRDNIFLGKLIHLNRSTINIINNIVDYDTSPFSAMRDMFVPMPIINEGIVIYPDGPNLSFNKSAGKLYGMGINWTNDQKSPNTVNIPAAINISGFFYSNQFSRSTSPTNFIDPTKYDVGGVITTIGGGSNNSTNQRVYQFTTGTIIVQYGQTIYSSLSNAVAGANSEMFIRTPAVVGSAVLIGIISMVKGATDLSNITQAIFSPVSMFGESTGGTFGTSTTNLQQSYDNSIEPEILTNNILGALSIRRGSNDEKDNVIEIQNGIGTNVFTINGLGETVISSISGVNGSIVTHDTSGKLLNSGILINSLTPLTTTSNISAYLGTLTSNSSANALIQANSFTINTSANLQQQISIISQSQTQGLTGNYVSLNKSETISGQKTFTSPITLTNGTTAQFYTSLITQNAPFNNFIVDQFNVGPFNGCNWDVVIKDNSNLRICNVMAGWISGQSSYTESNAPDIGDTSSVALSVSLISGGTVISLQSTAIGGSIWTIKSLRKCL